MRLILSTVTSQCIINEVTIRRLKIKFRCIFYHLPKKCKVLITDEQKQRSETVNLRKLLINLSCFLGNCREILDIKFKLVETTHIVSEAYVFHQRCQL